MTQSGKNYLIVGASRGLGKAFADGLPEENDFVFTVSRTPPSFTNIRQKNIIADLRLLDTHGKIKNIVQDTPIDVLIYNAGIWEVDSFEKTDDEMLINIINVNLTNAMLISKAILPNIRKGSSRKIIFIGSTAGLENYPSDSIAYAAAKFGLRGLTNSLRKFTRTDGIAVTCISPGSMATDVELSDGEQAALNKYKNKRIPLSDLVKIVKTLIELSPASCVKEISLPAQFDECL